uniref:Uncharacterized protein n=1 Tax=Periophthalmus magnuspinnatus TaxID=409849 RepID=A0A3B3ZVA1_9GOBI
IHPFDPFGQIMQEHFRKLNSALYALNKYPDADAQRRRLLDNGWEQCVCLDMNCFYFGLVPEAERSKIEKLEPFDEYEEWHQKCSHYFILAASRGLRLCILASPLTLGGPSFSPVSLPVKTIPVCAEGLGMASASLGPNVVLLTGGSSKGASLPLSSPPSLSVSSSLSLSLNTLNHYNDSTCCIKTAERTTLIVTCLTGVRLYHTATAIPGKSAVVLGGRTSPLNPVKTVCKLTMDSLDLEGDDGAKLSVEPAVCAGEPPVSVDGAAPEPRFSHSACSYRGGVVMFGGLGRRGVPLGDTTLLKPTESGFCWQRLDIKPSVFCRYSHAAHVIGDKLLVVGGVWLASHVPGLAVVDLLTQSGAEYRLDVASVPWPLMLHSFCSEVTSSKELVLIGGGGNCFSFGTHLNPQPVVVDLGLITTDG